MEKTEIKIKTEKSKKIQNPEGEGDQEQTQKEKGQAPSLGSSETGVVERLALAPSALRVLGAPRLRH